MTLDQWMAEQGLDDEAVGARVGRDRVTISRIRRKKAVASPELISMLVKLTGGQVPAEEFLPEVDLPVIEAAE